MARERISVRKIIEVLRLTYDVGLSQRQVAASLGLANGTVATYLARATTAGIRWPLPEGMSEAEVGQRLFPPSVRNPIPSRQREPDFAGMHQELGRKGVTLLLLWQEYQALDPATSYSYPHFCVRYQAWRKRLKLSLRQVHQAGEKVFVDYAGPTVPVVDRQTGGIRSAQIFVAVLGFSNYTFAEATWTQSVPDWIGSHVRTLTFFGGVPQLIVPDNLKAGVSKACRYEPELNPAYAELAAHYHTAVLPARPYKPRDKAKVEVAVQIVERWILARLRHQQFFSLPQLNTAIGNLLMELNHRPFKKLPGTRYSQFVTHDQLALTPLPPVPYEYAEWKQARVNIDYHIEVDAHYYSVPHRLVRQRVDVRLTAAMLEVFCKGERVASHRRSPRTGSFTTLADHMPLSHQRHRDWTPDRFLTWAQTLGPHTRTLVEQLLQRRYPEQGYRSCLGLLNLVKRYGPTRLEAACERAITLGAYTRRSVASILEHRLDQEPLTAPLPPTIPIVHENLRGPSYYH
jgi:transposase